MAIKLPPQSFVALAAVGWADGSLRRSEVTALVDAARKLGLEGADLAAVEQSTKTPVQLEAFDPGATWIRESAERIRAQLAAERPWLDIGAFDDDLRKLHEAYVASRRDLLNREEREADEARAAVKARPGYERLGDKDTHHVLRPISEARFDTTAADTAPALVDLRDRFKPRIEAAVLEANDRLDARLAADEKKPTPIVKIQTHLAGKELATREQLKAVLTELEARIGAQIDKGLRVRLL